MDYFDANHYFVLSHRQLWLSIFGSDREFSVRVLRFSVRLLKIEICTENCVISEVAITALSQKNFCKTVQIFCGLNQSENHVISEVAIIALSQKISQLNPRIPESLELFPGLAQSLKNEFLGGRTEGGRSYPQLVHSLLIISDLLSNKHN